MFQVLRHLVCKNLINRMLKNPDLLWKRTPKERRFPISSSYTQDDGEPCFRFSVILCAKLKQSVLVPDVVISQIQRVHTIVV